ncbi:phosphotransferase family protein [Desertihabitans aurantiacus]|uniref:phosphotransferase family protein n=1 Tax=Desertihabitans aurantiacus TaxID=2282477 RepID=UPI0013003B68|nr:phosphotransferase [Desertihabitans aurantiacus]
MRQGAVGQVRVVRVDGRELVEKRFADPARHDTEVQALRALAGSGLPVPELVAVTPGSVLMTLLPGERLDGLDASRQIAGISASAELLRELHRLPPPTGLPGPPDDARTIRRYRDAGGPPLPLRVPPATPPVFCHGDWTNGNLLLSGEEVSGVVDWEAAHVGDPLRELSRAAYGASRDDPRRAEALVEAYGADPADVRAWLPLHAAELWLWFREAGPPEYLDRLTRDLRSWPTAWD